jgi:hypothetical protein
MHIPTPQIAAPEFWLANLGRVQDYVLRNVRSGRLHDIGRSALGHPLHVVEYPQAGCPKLMVVGGTHGHEPGTVASVMNLIHLLETGRDLAGQPHDDLLALLGQVHLYAMPCLNPDGRAVCPDSFHAQGIDTVTIYSSGLRKDGSLIPYDADSDDPLYYFGPAEALFIGGQLNGAGYAMNRRRSPDESDAVEVQRLFEFVRDLGLDALLDLHACGYNFAFQARSHEAPYWPIMREWQRRAERLFGAKGRPLGALHGDGDPPEPPPFHFNSSLFHKHARLMWVSFEGRQGYLGRPSFMPLPTHWEIIDDYLTATRVFLELGVEGHYAQANREVFEG